MKEVLQRFIDDREGWEEAIRKSFHGFHVGFSMVSSNGVFCRSDAMIGHYTVATWTVGAGHKPGSSTMIAAATARVRFNPKRRGDRPQVNRYVYWLTTAPHPTRGAEVREPGRYSPIMNLSGHQSARMKTDTYLTPPAWVKALGPFDLDPCCPPVMPWPTAARMLTVRDNGLTAPWEGRVWLNPPFGQQAALWLRRLAYEHRNGIALIPARTETAMFYESVWAKADAVCFVRGRPHFHFEDGSRAPFNSGAPICLIAYGEDNAERLYASDLGVFVQGWIPPMKSLQACASRKVSDG